MKKKEYKRYLISYATLVLCVTAVLVTSISYYFSFLEKTDLINEFSSGAKDINMEVMKRLIDSYNAFGYFFSFYDMSDEFSVLTILLFAWLGIFVTSKLYKQKENGYGNWLVTRCGYEKYVKNTIIVQMLYIATIIGFIFLVQLVIAFAVGGIETVTYKNGETICGLGGCLLIVLGLYFCVVFYCVCINIISISLTRFVHNYYLIQAIPVVLFAIAPLLLGSTVANVFGWPQMIVDIIVPFNYFTCIFRMINNFYMSDLIALIVSMVTFLLVSIISIKWSVKKTRSNYL